MALENPLSYYTPGIPGRGAGTILKQPDLTAYAGRQMKLAEAKAAKKQADDAEKMKALSELVDLKGKWWEANDIEVSKLIGEFEKEAVAEWGKSGGNPGVETISKLKTKKLAIENMMEQSKRQETRYYAAIADIVSKAGNDDYDMADIDLAKSNMAAWYKMPIKDREANPIERYIPQAFDYNKHKSKVQADGLDSKTQVANMPTQINLNGRDVQVTAAYDIYSTAAAGDDLWSSYVNGRDRDKLGIEKRYEIWKQYNQNQTASYEEYIVDPANKKVNIVKHQNEPVADLKEWIYKVEAPTIAKYSQKQGLFSTGGTNVGVNITQPTQQQGKTPYQPYTYQFDVPGQGLKTGKYVAIKSSTNPFAKDVATTTPYQFTNNAFSFSGKPIDKKGNYYIDNAAADLVPVSTKPIKTTSGTIPAGTPLGDVAKFNVEAFVNNDANKDSWRWVAYYNVTARDPNTNDITTGVYEKVSDSPTLSDYFKGSVNYKGKDYAWIDYIRQWEQDVNAEWGTTGQTQQNKAAGKVITLAQYRAMSVAQRQAFINSGGTYK